MMKYIILICFFVIGVNYVNAQDKIIFGNNEVCENTIKLEYVFTGPVLMKFRDLFEANKINFINAKTKCTSVETNEKGIELIHLGVSIIEIYYKDNHYQKVYDKLLDLCKQNDWKKYRVELDYFKPGKIVILDKSQSMVKIISSNFCSNPKKLNELINYIKNNNSFDNLFYVECGGYNLTELTGR
ncbi:hypothetical protein [Flavobacterium sp.]|uniref:hypothetical protein n=1 Tax=Flavobacterium sp. TaxID=239 RepID=UPI003A8E09C2